MDSTEEIAAKLKALRPGESVEFSELTGQPQTSAAPKAEWEYGLATASPVHSSEQRIEQRVTPLNFKPEGLPQKLEGSADSFKGERYPAASAPPSDVHLQPNRGATQPKNPQGQGAGN